MQRTIRTIDCHYIRPRFAASFLVHEGGEAYFVEANTAHALPYLLGALRAEGIDRKQVKWIAVTHVHLDHAGGVAALLDACPEAVVLAHPRAVKHLVDPGKLIASAQFVYGEELFAELYGDVLPVPEERIRAVEDGEEIPFRGSNLRCIHTRGHANHHFCLIDPVLDGIFTGDSFGLAYPALQRKGLFIFPSSSPTDFDPQAALDTVERIVTSGVKRAFLTHFGEVRDLHTARMQLDEQLLFAGRLYGEAVAGNEEFETLRVRFAAALRENFALMAANAGLNLTDEDLRMMETDLRLNADGIAFAGIRAREESP